MPPSRPRPYYNTEMEAQESRVISLISYSPIMCEKENGGTTSGFQVKVSFQRSKTISFS